MKYMLLIQVATGEGAGEAELDAWMDYTQAMHQAGVWVSGEALADLVTATQVSRGADGAAVITDGPFAETREALGGFYVIDVPDLDAALDWAGRCPNLSVGGSVVVRPVAQF